MAGARDVSKRAAAKEPAALHLLLALLSDRGSGAHRALAQSGVDLARLRTAALQIVLGVVQARRPTRAADGGADRPAATPKGVSRRARSEADPSRTPDNARALQPSALRPLTQPGADGPPRVSARRS